MSKLELTDAEREKVFLRERDIDIMENDIESHKLELQLTFTVFQAVLNDDRTESVKRIMLDIYKSIKCLADDITRGIQNDQNPVPPSVKNNPKGLLRNSTYPTTTDFNMQLLRDFELYRLTSLYMGWIFSKVQPPDNYHDSTPPTRGPSWKFSAPIQMTVSTEELFLKVLGQISQRAKANRTLWDDYQWLLRSKRKRRLIDNLLRDQNAILQKDYPQLEWTLAGLEFTARKNQKPVQEAKTIQVILKTQFAPESQQTSPRSRAGAQITASTNASGGLVGGIEIPPGSERRSFTGGISGEQQGAGTGYGRKDMSGLPTTNNTGPQNTGFNTLRHKPRPKSSRIKRGIVLRHQQFVLVKREGKDSKGKHEKDRSRSWWWPWSNWKSLKISIEPRGPRSNLKGWSRGSALRSASHTPLPPHLDSGQSTMPSYPHTHFSQGDTPLRQGYNHDRGGVREEMTPAQEAQIIEGLFEEWDELRGAKVSAMKKSKKKKKKRTHYAGDPIGQDEQTGHHEALIGVGRPSFPSRPTVAARPPFLGQMPPAPQNHHSIPNVGERDERRGEDKKRDEDGRRDEDASECQSEEDQQFPGGWDDTVSYCFAWNLRLISLLSFYQIHDQLDRGVGTSSLQGLITALGLQRITLEETMGKLMDTNGLDVVLAPSDSTLVSYSACAGWPIATVPLGRTEHNGQPFRLFILARENREDMLLRFMKVFKATFPPVSRPTEPFKSRLGL
ncbi:hypothetical protein NUW58_g4251 [Xylaria curta]|uniref:Uncharacterized protein n=1 Tax=Xylaria curta TaxID=42375 RepID=A0ACC1P8W5_9PEZI|nr:hypothetical protein NUW58_g4251 [Xylaria curta]